MASNSPAGSSASERPSSTMSGLPAGSMSSNTCSKAAYSGGSWIDLEPPPTLRRRFMGRARTESRLRRHRGQKRLDLPAAATPKRFRCKIGRSIALPQARDRRRWCGPSPAVTGSHQADFLAAIREAPRPRDLRATDLPSCAGRCVTQSGVLVSDSWSQPRSLSGMLQRGPACHQARRAGRSAGIHRSAKRASPGCGVRRRPWPISHFATARAVVAAPRSLASASRS